MKIETLTEKIESGKFSAVIDYDSEQAIVAGFGAIPFDMRHEFLEFVQEMNRRIDNA